MAQAYARSRQRNSRNCREVEIALHVPRFVCAAPRVFSRRRVPSAYGSANLAVERTQRIRAPQETDVMAKGQQRSNRETKKPKKDKVKATAAAPSRKDAAWQPEIGQGKKK
jgi:hypothetical protein